MPAKSASQERLMQAAAHTKGGYGGVSQAAAKKFLGDASEEREKAMKEHRSDARWR